MVGTCFSKEGNKLVFNFQSELLWIEPWGENSLRVRGTKHAEIPLADWALLPQKGTNAIIELNDDGSASITNGKIRAELSAYGLMSFYNDKGELLLREYVRTRKDVKAEFYSCLDIEGRDYRPIPGGDFNLTMRFESPSDDEKLYGMGQYQYRNYNLKGMDLELAHRNSQASVPFVYSSQGYGLFWHNPAVGRAIFGINVTSFEAVSTKLLDYWITAGDTPAEIISQYGMATGTVPMMPDYAMGFWQCKLRYQTQEELLEVARGYHKRGVPVSVIVCDFFHWPYQGEWKFDPTYWPDPDAMIAELKDMGMELMVSIWPQVDYRSENFDEMLQKGYLIRTDRGVQVAMTYMGNTLHYDATHPGAREYVWGKAKKNYYDKGIKIFWLDEAEPEYTKYDFDNYRYHLGPNVQIGNIYPQLYAKTFYDGMEEEGQENIVNLLRCAWAGSQRYGALVWSGDIHSKFSVLRDQYAAGLHMGIAGIPWWTTDIGGFYKGETVDPKFHELLVRWFQYGTFCPVMRLHGYRVPDQPQVGTTGGAECLSGADNEIWSFGEGNEKILTEYIMLRERMRPYVSDLMKQAHEKGNPVMRTLFYEFPSDKEAWEDKEEYMFGSDVLVAPVMYENMSEREVYLPSGAKWTNAWTGEEFEGGQTIKVETPIERIPLFFRDGKKPFEIK